MKGYASHGESWSLALALRLASYDLLRSTGDDPILILDDVFAELDSERRERLAELVAGAEQVLVTAAVPEDLPRALAGVRIDVVEGQVAARVRVTGPTSSRRREPSGPRRRSWPAEPVRTTTRPGWTWPAASPGAWPAPGVRRGSGPARPVPAAARAATDPQASGAHPDDRDPQLLDHTIGRLIADQGWGTDVRVHGVFTRWEHLVGRDVAAHCTPESYDDGKLMVRTDSTAWRTQMKLLAPTVVRRLNDGARRRQRAGDRRARAAPADLEEGPAQLPGRPRPARHLRLSPERGYQADAGARRPI